MAPFLVILMFSYVNRWVKLIPLKSPEKVKSALGKSLRTPFPNRKVFLQLNKRLLFHPLQKMLRFYWDTRYTYFGCAYKGKHITIQNFKLTAINK